MSEEEPDLEQARLVGLSKAFRNHIVSWLRAVEVQESRVRVGLEQMTPSRWAEPQLFAVSLENPIRACWKCHKLYDDPPTTPFADAVNAFESAIPNARNIRDRLEHFDEYETRDGLSIFVTKAAVDGLVEAVLLVDDTRDHVLELHFTARAMGTTDALVIVVEAA